MKIKRILTGVLAGAFLTSMSAVSASAASETDIGKLGDPTGDGQINAVDASNILSIYADISVEAEELTEELLAVCDVNKDGSINAVDASLVLSYYASQATDDEEKALEEFLIELLDDFGIDPDAWFTEPVDPSEWLELWGNDEHFKWPVSENPWGLFDPLLDPDYDGDIDEIAEWFRTSSPWGVLPDGYDSWADWSAANLDASDDIS